MAIDLSRLKFKRRDPNKVSPLVRAIKLGIVEPKERVSPRKFRASVKLFASGSDAEQQTNLCFEDTNSLHGTSKRQVQGAVFKPRGTR